MAFIDEDGSKDDEETNPFEDDVGGDFSGDEDSVGDEGSGEKRKRSIVHH